MAALRCKVLTIIFCLWVYTSKVYSDNRKCAILKDVFTDCPCRPATEPGEKGSADSVIDCSNKKLTAVPILSKSYDGILYKLILKNNLITDLTDNSFQGIKLEYLDLTGNSLISLENNTFLSMSDSLKTLEIDGDTTNKPPIHALNKLNVIESLTMRDYNVPLINEGDNFFLSFSRLKSLTLDNWKIDHMESQSFYGLDYLQSLTFLNQEFETLPVDALREDPFDNLETLKISKTKVTKVSFRIFENLKKLKNLDLSDNLINELESDCFYGVSDTLENINLSENDFNSQLSSKLDGLSGLTSLQQLDFSINNFQRIPSIPNLNPKKGFNLLLIKNEIAEVQENAFNGYASNLGHLDLSVNKISKMNYQAFRGVNNLRSLNIKSNDVTLSLPISLTNSASTLHEINVSGQKVDPNALWTVIKDLTSLKSLNLRHTELVTIPDFTFEKVTGLEKLDLGFNDGLHELHQTTLVGLRQLQTLNLESTEISTIPSCLFHGFQAAKIVLIIENCPIKCDCQIRKLLEDIKSGRIELGNGTLGTEVTCRGDLAPITMKDPDKLCPSSFEEKTCINYYSTASSTSEPVFTSEPPKLELQVLKVGEETIKASWTISDDSDLQKYRFEATSSNQVVEFTRDNMPTSKTSVEATGLPADTYITICVSAYFRNNRATIHECKVNKTLGFGVEKKKNDSNDPNTAIIVGCAVAGVAFIGVVVAIIILLVFRRRPKRVPENYRASTQPRNFAKAELPSMTEESRKFAKPKKNGKSPNHESMQVVAISDGQTSPGARVGRANMMFQDEDGYEPMSNLKLKKGSESSSFYENDHGALPPTPGQDSIPPAYPGGYYNQGFREDRYDEVEM